jgi:hypothetical protein
MMEDKRRLERFRLKAPAKIIPIHSGGKKRALDLVTSNICAGGGFFRTSYFMPEGTEVKIDIILPLDRLKILKNSSKQVHLKIRGKVLRSEADGFAVCFEDDYRISQLDLNDQAEEKGNATASHAHP